MDSSSTEKASRVTDLACRDQTNQRAPLNKPQKKKVRFATAEQQVMEDVRKEKESIEEKGYLVRLKVRMTREEAARMLSFCKEGGILDFKDAARELVRVPSSHVRVLISPSG